MASLSVRVEGLSQFRRELKAANPKFGRELAKAHKKAGDHVANKAKGPLPARVRKSAIRGRGTQRGAFVDVVPVRGDELGVLMGAKRRVGWYSQPKYGSSSGRQFEPWVGNQWEPGSNAGKPYFIGAPINSSVDDVVEILGDALEDAAKRAFPDRS